MRWVVLAVLVGCGRIAFDPQGAAGDATGSNHDGGLGSDGGGSAAIDFIQAKGSGYDTATTGALAWPAAVTTGDLLLVGIDFGSSTGTVATVTDDLHNTWTLAGPIDGYTREYVAYAIANGTGLDTTQVSVTESSNYLELRLHEYRGVSATTPLDGVFGNSIDTMPATVSVTTHAPNQLVFVMTIFIAATTPSAGTGFTLRDNYADDLTEDKIVTTPGTLNATTMYSSFSQWTSMVAVFNPN